jgi:carbon-monoxide dehydrogenase medium subunit
MKAPAFEFVSVHHLDEVFTLLDEYGDEARIVAGGQTLVATLNMRLSEPALLIDIRRLPGLAGISVNSGKLRVGALATHTEIEESPVIAQHAPLLKLAAPHIAHRAIRNRGTFGGSIAYADPAAEWPACTLALEAEFIAVGRGGERRIAAKEFFLGLFTTALKPGEILVAAEIPCCDLNESFAFDELARRHGDYAIVGLAGGAARVADRLTRVRLAYLGVGVTPVRARQTELYLEGKPIDPTHIAHALGIAQDELSVGLESAPDPLYPAAMKRHLAGVLLRRVLATLESPVRTSE